MMDNTSLSGIDYARHQRWLARAAGLADNSPQLFVLDVDGNGVWPDGFTPPAALQQALHTMAGVGDALRCLEPEPGQTIFLRGLRASDGNLTAWAGARFGLSVSEHTATQIDALAECVTDRSTTWIWCWSRCAATCSASSQSSRTTLVINNTDDPAAPTSSPTCPTRCWPARCSRAIEMPAMLVLLNHAAKPDFTNSDRRLGEVMAHQIANVMHMQHACSRRCGASPNRWPPR
jgi:hypothetical protein